jgi:rhamnose utilization protein RhaD (predicted bifunctional aldolase and dehydrogenase)
VKASGKKLRNALTENIFLPLNLKALQDQINDNQFDLSAKKLLDNDHFLDLRPSIETGLHAVIPRKYVVHLHPIGILSMLVRVNLKKTVEKLFSLDDYLLVPYIRPGKDLTKYVYLTLKKRGLPKLIFLANHGIVISGETLSDTQITLSKVLHPFFQASCLAEKPTLDAIKNLSTKVAWHLPTFDEVHCLAINQIILNRARSGILYPDHIVFLGKHVYSAPEGTSNLVSWLSQPDIKELPYIIIPQIGVLTNPNLSQDGHELLLAWYRVLRAIPQESQINYLSSDEINAIDQWEAEKYRKQLSFKK